MGEVRRVAAAGVIVALLLAACSSPTPPPPSTPTATADGSPRPSVTGPSSARPTPSGSPSTSPTPTTSPSAGSAANAVVGRIGDVQWARIVAAGMARAGCPMTQTSLRRIEVNHWGFDGAVHRGVLVVNADVAVSVARIFTRLFAEHVPIRRMRPMEEYGGDDLVAMRADDTSAFNCRSASQANSPAARSPHANGRAVDVNPLENPWKDPRCTCWSPSAAYGENRVGRGVILEHGPVWTAFTDEGWIWQDIKVADYMHFDTGYPSLPVLPSASASASGSGSG